MFLLSDSWSGLPYRHTTAGCFVRSCCRHTRRMARWTCAGTHTCHTRSCRGHCTAERTRHDGTSRRERQGPHSAGSHTSGPGSPGRIWGSHGTLVNTGTGAATTTPAASGVWSQRHEWKLGQKFECWWFAWVQASSATVQISYKRTFKYTFRALSRPFYPYNDYILQKKEKPYIVSVK